MRGAVKPLAEEVFRGGPDNSGGLFGGRLEPIAPNQHRRRSFGFPQDRKSTRLNSSHGYISNAGLCLEKKERYAKTSRTFGITTLRKSHVSVRGSRIAFRYPGKHRSMVHSAIVYPELACVPEQLIAQP